MKTLKALKHLVLGYKLHPKEHMRLDSLWFNIKIGILTILIIILIVSMLSGMGFFETRVGF